MISDLIDRLSKLDAPDREVDALIVAELEPHIFDAPGFKPIRPVPSFHLAPQGDAIRFDGGGIMCLSYFPRLTASVDAAIALAERVLPGWKRSFFENFNGKWIARVCSPRRDLYSTDYLRDTELGGSPNGGIALCIAILRAKEASKL